MGGTRLGYSSKHVEVREALQAFCEERKTQRWEKEE
jgi:hypothetical protein